MASVSFSGGSFDTRFWFSDIAARPQPFTVKQSLVEPVHGAGHLAALQQPRPCLCIGLEALCSAFGQFRPPGPHVRLDCLASTSTARDLDTYLNVVQWPP